MIKLILLWSRGAGFWILWPSLGKSYHSLWNHSLYNSRSNKSWKKVSRANCFRLISSFLCRNNLLLLSSGTRSIKFLCQLCWRCCWITVVHWSILWVCSGSYVQYRLVFPGNFFFLFCTSFLFEYMVNSTF